MTLISLLIPTFRRPKSLRDALLSVFAQDLPPLTRLEIIISDNSPEAGAKSTFDNLLAHCPHDLLYVHAPSPGVANARNMGLKAASGRYVAFLDDDEIANPNWLKTLYKDHVRLNTDVTFGPIRGRVSKVKDNLRPYLEAFFSRNGPSDSQRIEGVYGCGNSIMTRETALKGDAPFDPIANETGGEDDLLFHQIKDEGGHFGWSAQAWVDELAPDNRANLAYALKRAFAYGQSPCQEAALRHHPLSILRHQFIGCFQALILGTLSAVMWVLMPQKAPFILDKAARGLGKVFWRVKIRLYGQALI